MDDQVKIVTRTSMTFVDVLNSVGGLMSIIVVFAVVLISYFQEIIYFTNMVKSMFLY